MSIETERSLAYAATSCRKGCLFFMLFSYFLFFPRQTPIQYP